MLCTRWSAEAWSMVRVELKRALALRSEILRAAEPTDERFIALVILLAPFAFLSDGSGALCCPGGSVDVARPRLRCLHHEGKKRSSLDRDPVLTRGRFCQKQLGCQEPQIPIKRVLLVYDRRSCGGLVVVFANLFNGQGSIV